MFPGIVYAALAEKIGRNKAFQLCLHGERIGAAEAYDAGLVDSVPETFDPEKALSQVESRLSFLHYYRQARSRLAQGQEHDIPQLMNQNRNTGGTMEMIESYLNGIRERR